MHLSLAAARIALLFALPVFYAWAQPQQREAPGTTVDFSELTARYKRLEEAHLLQSAPERLRAARPLVGPTRERPRPGQLLRPPRFEPATAKRTALALPGPAAISPDTPRMLSGFPALDDNLTANPPDTHGAVGPNHIMTVLNSEILIQTRDGRPLGRLILEDFFRTHSPVTLAYDPRVVYDPKANRWIFCVLAEPESARNALYVAVSQTPDPSGQWNLFRIGPADGSWLDYPTLALHGPWILLTLNQYALTGGRFQGGALLVFTAQDLYDGRGRFRNYYDIAMGAPVHDPLAEAGKPAALVLAFDDNNDGEGVLRISELRGEPGVEEYTDDVRRLRVPQPWRYAAVEDNLGPQLGTNIKLDLGDDRMLQCVQRNNSIWCVHTIFLPAGNAPVRSAAQWLELARDPAGAYRFVRHGRVEDATGEFHYAYPSIAVNRDNDVLLGYSRFSSKQYVSAHYSYRQAADPAGQFQADALIKQGEAPYRARGQRRNRWGGRLQRRAGGSG